MSSNKNITGTWNISRGTPQGGEDKGEPFINSVDQQGKIKGTVFGTEIKEGFYFSQSFQIQFRTSSMQTGPKADEQYIGHLYPEVNNTLAGIYF